jgi:hypothetical protein
MALPGFLPTPLPYLGQPGAQFFGQRPVVSGVLVE